MHAGEEGGARGEEGGSKPEITFAEDEGDMPLLLNVP